MSSHLKRLFSSQASALAVAVAATASSLTGGCANMEPARAPEASQNRIVTACIWPGDANRVTYVTRGGDVYDVRTSYPSYATITAYLNEASLRVSAYYNAASFTVYNAASGEMNGLTVGYPLILDSTRGGVYPSRTEMARVNGDYSFRAAAAHALDVNYRHPARRPNVFCREGFAGAASPYFDRQVIRALPSLGR